MLEGFPLGNWNENITTMGTHMHTHAHFVQVSFEWGRRVKTNHVNVFVHYVLKEESSLNICSLFIFYRDCEGGFLPALAKT